MANRFVSYIKKKILGKNNNLISLENPYDVMAKLLKNSHVTGILDIGANNGHISKRLLKRFPKAQAYAFEPNPLYTEVLGQYAKKMPGSIRNLLGFPTMLVTPTCISPSNPGIHRCSTQVLSFKQLIRRVHQCAKSKKTK
jgi:hypothetical protein